MSSSSSSGGPSETLTDISVEVEGEHQGGGQLLLVRVTCLTHRPGSRCSVMTSSAWSFSASSRTLQVAEHHHASVLHRRLEGRSRQHHAVEQGDGQAGRLSISETTEESTAGRPMEEHPVVVTGVAQRVRRRAGRCRRRPRRGRRTRRRGSRMPVPRSLTVFSARRRTVVRSVEPGAGSSGVVMESSRVGRCVGAAAERRRPLRSR